MSASYLAFAVFGGLWGTWGAALPQVRDRAAVTDAQLGLALLLVAAGALPAMAVTGRLTDRFGRRVPALALLALAASGVAVAVTARSFVSLAVGLTVLGAASGAADVAINAVAGDLERRTGRPVITRSHAAFSAAVVTASLLTGLLARLGASLVTPFTVVLVAAVPAAVALLRGHEAAHVALTGKREPLPRRGLLVTAGAVAALGLAVENAHQSWGAVYLGDELGVRPGLTAAAPALFAGVAAVTRLAAGSLAHVHPVVVLTAGGLIAGAGTLVVATAGTVPVALAGLAVTAVGTSVLFPTLLRTAIADVGDDVRGRATSAVATTAYVGFLVGPVVVGQVAQAGGLRTAMLAVAALAGAFTAASVPLCRRLGSVRETRLR